MTQRVCVQILIVALHLLGIQAKSQIDSARSRYGIVVGYGQNFHTADFRQLPGVPNCCPRFESGDGSGLNLAALYERPLYGGVMLGVRAGMNTHSATLTADEATTLAVNGQSKPGVFRHTVAAELKSASLEPYLSVHLFSGLRISVGAQIGWLHTAIYTQEERITEPQEFASFLDSNGVDTRSRVRNQSSGNLPNASQLLASASAALSYELPMNNNKTLFLVPSLHFSYSLNTVVKQLAWNAAALSPSLSIQYSPPFSLSQLFRRQERIDTVRRDNPRSLDTLISLGRALSTKEEYDSTEFHVVVETLVRTDTLMIGTKVQVVETPKKPSVDTITIAETIGASEKPRPKNEQSPESIKSSAKEKEPKVVSRSPKATADETPTSPQQKKTESVQKATTTQRLPEKQSPTIALLKDSLPVVEAAIDRDVQTDVSVADPSTRCCHLMFLSTDDKEKATACHLYLSRSIPSVRIIERTNSEGTQMYSVVSPCSSHHLDAAAMMQQLQPVIRRALKNFHIPEAPRIKCFDKK